MPRPVGITSIAHRHNLEGPGGCGCMHAAVRTGALRAAPVLILTVRFRKVVGLLHGGTAGPGVGTSQAWVA